MRRSWAVLIAVLLVGCGKSELTVANTDQPIDSRLAPYLNLDLRGLHEKPKRDLGVHLATMLPSKYHVQEHGGYEPWFIWEHENEKGKRGFLVFQVLPIIIIPGGS